MKILTIYFKVKGGNTQRWKYIIENETDVDKVIARELEEGMYLIKTKVEDLILKNGYAYLNLVD